MAKEKDYFARLVVRGLPSMTPNQLKMLKAWISQLRNIVKKPHQFSAVFTSKLMKNRG